MLEQVSSGDNQLQLAISKQRAESTRLIVKSTSLPKVFILFCFAKPVLLTVVFFSIRNIPSVDEAWKLPIPAELTTRTIRNAQVRTLVKNYLTQMYYLSLICLLTHHHDELSLIKESMYHFC